MVDELKWTGAVSGDPAAAGNWNPEQAPISGDTLRFENNAVDVDTNLDQSAILPAAVYVSQSYTGKLGTATAPLRYGQCAILDIGDYGGPGSPNGSTRINIELVSATGGATPVVTVHNSSSSSAETNLAPIRLLIGDINATATLRALKGKVALAAAAGEVSAVKTIDLDWVGQRNTDVNLEIGDSVTGLTDIVKDGGNLTLKSPCTNVTNRAGNCFTSGSGAITVYTNEGGTGQLDSTGTVTTVNANGGKIDGSKTSAPRTWTTVNRRGKGELRYDPAVVTIGTLNAGGAIKVAAA